VGILVDDLITKGCLEPYRMFTSRAEHRLLLRIDNADLRLTPRARDVGLIDAERWDRFEARRSRYEFNLRFLDQTLVRQSGGQRVPASQLLRQPSIRLQDLLPDLRGGDGAGLQIDRATAALDIASAETAVKYAGYLKRQASEIERARRDERRRIPTGFPFERVPGLSREVIQRLRQVQPDTLGHALRIPGVTPAAVAVLASFVGRAAVE
jgi:tRNA uridine 5-carboxymethylaminomethyl modification enzyme